MWNGACVVVWEMQKRVVDGQLSCFWALLRSRHVIVPLAKVNCLPHQPGTPNSGRQAGKAAPLAPKAQLSRCCWLLPSPRFL